MKLTIKLQVNENVSISKTLDETIWAYRGAQILDDMAKEAMSLIKETVREMGLIE